MVVVMVLMINRVGGAAVNGDVSNIKHLIGETWWQSYKQVKK